MAKAIVIDICGLGAICLWLLLSVLFAYWGNGPIFERLGALGTASAVGYFAFVRPSLPSPVGLHKRLTLLQGGLNQHAQALLFVNRNVTFVSDSVRVLFERSGNPTPPIVKELSDPSLLEHGANIALPIDEWEKTGEKLLNQSLAADEGLMRLAFRSGNLQATVVVISTLQWGFGSLFIGASP